MCLVRTVSAIEVLRGIQIVRKIGDDVITSVQEYIATPTTMDHMGMGLKDAGRGRGVVNNVGQCCYNCYTNKQITLH